jgi:hypothetical protein
MNVSSAKSFEATTTPHLARLSFSLDRGPSFMQKADNIGSSASTSLQEGSTRTAQQGWFTSAKTVLPRHMKRQSLVALTTRLIWLGWALRTKACRRDMMPM